MMVSLKSTLGFIAVLSCHVWLVHSANAQTSRPLLTKPVIECDVPIAQLHDMSFDAKGNRLALFFGGALDHDKVRVWECSGWEHIDAKVEADRRDSTGDRTSRIVFDNEGLMLAGTAGIYGLSTDKQMELIMPIRAAGTQSLRRHNGSDLLRQSIANDRELTISKLSKAATHNRWKSELMFSLELESKDSSITCANVSDDGIVVAVGIERAAGDHREYLLQVWRSKDRTKLFERRAHDDRIRSIAIDKLGALVVSGGADGRICVWDVKTGKLSSSVNHSMGILSVDFIGGGNELCVLTSAHGGKDNLFIIDTESKKMMASANCDERGAIMACVSPTKTLVSAVSISGKMRVWETKTLLPNWK